MFFYLFDENSPKSDSFEKWINHLTSAHDALIQFYIIDFSFKRYFWFLSNLKSWLVKNWDAITGIIIMIYIIIYNIYIIIIIIMNQS